jgi:hypothetical protein
MTDFGFLPILIDRRNLQHIRIHCRCGHDWVEEIPGEVHNSSLTMALFCPKCEAAFTLCNKRLTRREDGAFNKVMHRDGTWTQSGGEA